MQRKNAEGEMELRYRGRRNVQLEGEREREREKTREKRIIVKKKGEQRTRWVSVEASKVDKS